MRDLSRNGYSHDEIVKMLHGVYGKREMKIRYDLLDRDENKKAELFEVESGEVTMSAFANIKRTARFSLREQYYFVEGEMTWKDLGNMKWSDL